VTSFVRIALCIGAVLFAMPSVGVSAPDPYNITAFLSLTGGAAFAGNQEAKGFAALESYVNRTGGINGRPIHFVVSDDQSSPEVSVQLLNAAISAKVPMVIGGGLSGSCNAMAALVKDTGPLLYCIAGGPKPMPGSYVFLSGFSSFDQISTAIGYFQRNGLNRIGVLSPTDASGQEADRTIQDVLALPERQSAHVVDQEHFGNTDISVTAQMSRLKAANVQALIVWTTGNPLGTALHAMRDVGFDVPVVATAGNLVRLQMIGYASFMPSMMLVAAPPMVVGNQVPNGPIKRSIAIMNDEFGRIGVRPEAVHAVIWDSSLIFVAALKKYGTTMTPAQLRSYVDGIRDWNGPWGRFDFQASPQRGLQKDSLYLVRWDPAKEEFTAVSKAGGN
jgi:branched-chain amino acid transport system substrate-binding protein